MTNKESFTWLNTSNAAANHIPRILSINFIVDKVLRQQIFYIDVWAVLTKIVIHKLKNEFFKVATITLL